MNGTTGVPIAQQSLWAIVIGAVIGLLAGIALAYNIDSPAGTNISDIGPFTAPTEMCSFSTFETTAPADVPTMVSKCDYFFDDRHFFTDGYRI